VSILSIAGISTRPSRKIVDRAALGERLRNRMVHRVPATGEAAANEGGPRP